MTSQQFASDRLAAFSRGDVEAIMAQYQPDAVVITPQGTMRGTAQIRPMIEGIIGEFAKPGVTFNLLHQAAEGPVVNFVWKADTGSNLYDLGTETYLQIDGKAAYQTFAAKMSPKQ